VPHKAYDPAIGFAPHDGGQTIDDRTAPTPLPLVVGAVDEEETATNDGTTCDQGAGRPTRPRGPDPLRRVNTRLAFGDNVA